MSETLTHQWYLRDIADGLRADGQPVLAEKLEAAAAEIDRLEALVQSLRVPSVGFGDAR